MAHHRRPSPRPSRHRLRPWSPSGRAPDARYSPPSARHRFGPLGCRSSHGAADRTRRRSRRARGRRRRGSRVATAGLSSSEAGAGLGKSALLEYTARLATDAGCRVLHAAPGPLERHFPFGVVRALLEMPVRDAAADDRAVLLDGAAATAGELLLDGTVPGGDAMPMVAHSVLWLCSALADERPLVLVVDDAHWADRCSLQILAYVARRVADRPVLIVAAARADDPDAASDLLSLLGEGRAAAVLHPQPLSPSGTVELIHRVAPDTPIDVCVKCHRAGGGNPWLLGELGRQIAVHGPDVIEAEDDEAPPVTAIARNVVRRRLAALSPRDRAVCEVLAVIEDDASPHVVAAVAGVPVAELGPARDALVAAGLLAADANGFAHNLIALAVAEDLPRTAYERLHRETARALMAMGVSADMIGQPPAALRPVRGPRGQRVAAPCGRRRRATRGAPHRGRVPRARARRARPGRRPRADARAARRRRVRRRAARFARAAARGARRRFRQSQPRRHADAARRAQHRRPRRPRAGAAAGPRARQRDRPARADRGRDRDARRAERAAGPRRRAGAADRRDRPRRDRGSRAAPARPRPRGWLGVETGTTDAATCAALALRRSRAICSCTTRAVAPPTTWRC